MNGIKTKSFWSITLLSLLIAILFLSIPVSAKDQNYKKFPYNPIIFVHGGSGSGSQFESQAMRFTSNGYAHEFIFVHEYDSSYTINTRDDILAGLDELIAKVLETTGAEQVDILGHSHGTTIMHDYLGRPEGPERAEKIAHYVNIDGRSSDTPPGGVPTLALWAEWRSSPGWIGGAENVTIPGTTHIEVATCAESFFEMYKFFTGEPPKTTEILPEPRGKIRIAGRAVLFPLNVGAVNATVKIYELNGCTGYRIYHRPRATYNLGEDGSWGPFKAKAGQHYEFVIEREGMNDHHFYYETFIRSDYLVRLNTSLPDGIASYMDTSDYHSNMVVSRNREFWGDQGINNDILAINGVNVVNEAICPISKRVSAIFVYDVDADGESDLSQATFYALFPFLTGLDLFVPGAEPSDGTTRLALLSRGEDGIMQVINIPNWASSADRVSVVFNDFAQWDNMACCN
jgi:hypothetical protein